MMKVEASCHGSGWGDLGIWGSEAMGLSSSNNTLLLTFCPDLGFALGKILASI